MTFVLPGKHQSINVAVYSANTRLSKESVNRIGDALVVITISNAVDVGVQCILLRWLQFLTACLPHIVRVIQCSVDHLFSRVLT